MAHRVSPRATADLDEIWLYVAEESGSPNIAQRLTDSITDRFYVLSEHPYLGRSRSELGPGLRSHPVRNYLIFYRVDEGDVLIVRVLHGNRDIEAVFRDSASDA
jgi:toxin ParE1/3/4